MPSIILYLTVYIVWQKTKSSYSYHTIYDWINRVDSIINVNLTIQYNIIGWTRKS
jgi:hypothetical protein